MVSPYTVVIPARNAAHMIADALRSALVQTMPPARIIVVDDGSSDDTASVAAAFGAPVEVVSQPNAGPGSATTRGFELVATELVATLDADDIWLPGKIARQTGLLEADPDIAGIFGRMVNFKGSPAAASHDLPYEGWSRTTMLIRTDVVRKVGPVRDSGEVGDMVDWLARVREAGHRLVMLPEILALRRIHPDSMTSGGGRVVAAGYLNVVREAMLRRRARGDGGDR